MHGEQQQEEWRSEEQQGEDGWLRSHGRRARSRYSAHYAGYMGSAGYMGEEDEERELEEEGYDYFDGRPEFCGGSDDDWGDDE